MKKIVVCIVAAVIVILIIVFNIPKTNFSKNYGINSKMEIDIKTKEEYKKILSKKSVIIFVGSKNSLSKKYAKEIDKISKDYNKEFYYYYDNDTKVIGIDKEKKSEEFNGKSKINSGIDKIFDDVTSGACTEEEKC